MRIRLFPDQFIHGDKCFGLFVQGEDDKLDSPVTIEGDAGIPFHIIHSDPDHLAYLVGLIVLQSWTSGIEEVRRQEPALLDTDKAVRFDVNQLLAALISLGVADARRLEEALNKG